MAFGLRIYNDYSTIQIDENYSNLMLVYRGVHSFSRAVQSSSMPRYAVSIEFYGVKPFCAWRCANAYTALYEQREISPNNWRFTIHTNDPNGQSLEVFIFDDVGVRSSGLPAYGLVVRKADGTISYQDNIKPIVIQSVLKWDIRNGNGSQFVFPQRKYAFGVSQMAYRWPGSGTDTYSYLFMPTSTGVVSGEAPLTRISSRPSTPRQTFVNEIVLIAVDNY